MSTKWHGYSRLERTYRDMIQRCYNPRATNYDRYGGRGIIVCDEWKENPQAFIEWALANGYDNRLTGNWNSLDRIDNDKGYSPDNCRWVDIYVQASNRNPRQDFTRYPYNGEMYTVGEFAKIVRMSSVWVSKKMKEGLDFQRMYELKLATPCASIADRSYWEKERIKVLRVLLKFED